MKTLKIFLFVFTILFGMGSCKKSKLDKDTVVDEDNSTAENLFSMVGDDADNASAEIEDEQFKTNKTEGWPTLDTCATITFTFSSDSTYISSIVIDFGDGCTNSNNGRIRKGIIRISQTGRRLDVGTIRTVTLENFYINDYRIEGTRTVTTESIDLTTGTFRFIVQVTGGRITDNEGRTFTWESTRTREVIVSTTEIRIRVLAGGTITGTNRNGRAFTGSIVETLERLSTCRWFTRGIIEMIPEDLSTRRLDFGDGTCDNKAIVTVKNKTHEITLR